MEQLTIQEYWSTSHRYPLLDVRTPAEWQKGHIPGSLNFPLFSNEERAIIGTQYKQESPEKAFLTGLRMVGPRMAEMVEKASQLLPDRKVVVHCWRGGQRSGSVAWLLEQAGFEVQVITGGYKAFRRMLHQYFETPFGLRVLSGPTGSGKTEVLHALAGLGEQVIDLEGLAHHKGSAFGGLGQGEQPTTESFENQLFAQLSVLDTSRPIWVENENRMIGTVCQPEGWWQQLRQAPIVQLEVAIEQRVSRLLAEYGQFSAEALKAAFTTIRKRLGGQHLKTALLAIDEGRLAEAARIALVYYDKAYTYGREQEAERILFTLAEAGNDPTDIAQQLIHHV